MTIRDADPQMGEVPVDAEIARKANLMRRVLRFMDTHDAALARLHDLLDVQIAAEDGETIVPSVEEVAEVYGLMYLALTDTDALADMDDKAAEFEGVVKLTETDEYWQPEPLADKATHLVIRVY